MVVIGVVLLSANLYPCSVVESVGMMVASALDRATGTGDHGLCRGSQPRPPGHLPVALRTATSPAESPKNVWCEHYYLLDALLTESSSAFNSDDSGSEYNIIAPTLRLQNVKRRAMHTLNP